MTNKKVIVHKPKCPKCLGETLPTLWAPGLGFDPHMVQFKCTRRGCYHIFYQVIHNPDSRIQLLEQAGKAVPNGQ